MLRIALLLAAGAALGFGQYTWHTTTTTFPPQWPQWIEMIDGSGGALAYQTNSNSGGETRTTLAPASGQWSSVKHYLGMRLVPDDYSNPNAYKYDGYTVTLSGVAGQPSTWTAVVHRQFVDYTFSYVFTQLASVSVSEPTTGTVFSSSIRQGEGVNGQSMGINVRLGAQVYYIRIDPLTTYQYFGFASTSGMVTDARVGVLDEVAPNAVTGLAAPISNGVINATWNAAADDANGIGGVRYEVYKDATLLGTTAATNWTLYVNPGENFVLKVKALDGHRNFNAGSTLTVSVGSSQTGGALIDDSLRTGVHSQGAHWGAMGETIDMRSMNMNYTIPLLKAQGRSGMGLGISLSYNSQNWRKENSTVTQAGFDVGYGFGWRLQAGSIFPVFSTPTTLSYFIFTDSTGAKYKLDQQSGNVWTTKEGLTVWFDVSTYKLYFGDGSSWSFGCVSAANEQDAGTRYPTLIQDRHGNQLVIAYGNGNNASARISYIDDVRSTFSTQWKTYSFTYNNDAIPHLTGITNQINTAEAYTFSYSAQQPLYEPFNGTQQFGSAVWLNSMTQSGVNLTTSFQYNSSGEMTKLTFPLGGEMMWNYTNQSYAGGRQAREVLSRDLRKATGAATVNYAFTHPTGDSALKYHSETTLADPSTVGQRRWTFFTTTDFKQGLLSKYEELDSWVVKTRTENTWSYVSPYSPRITEVLNTIDVGQSFQKQSKRTQVVDNYGNVVTTSVFGYGNLTTAIRTDSCTYTTANSNYVSRYIVNIATSCSSTENGVTLTSGTMVLDGQTLAAVPNDIRLWVNPNSTFRGLVTSLNDGYATRTSTYNLAGQPVSGGDGQGLSQTITYGGVGGSVVPTQITPNGNSGLGTSMNWNGFLGLTSVTSGNGGSQAFGYDAYARPSTQTSADGATTTFNYFPSSALTRATVNGRFTNTYHDGLGRPVRVETWDGTSVKSIVDTEYEPCACSPAGKMKRVSLPYVTGGTVYWTTYTYDGLGRTLTVAQPNGAGTTTYLYEGNTVKVTSPSSKWKKYEMDVLGRMVQVTEPRPGGGTYLTNYTYNLTGKLVGVSMPRDGVTQTRTFTYDTTSQSRLLTSTNPENGTVTFTYNLDGTTATKVDAKGIKTEFSYDSYKRVLQMRKLTQVSSVWTEDRCQRVDYFYDEGGGANNGRLTRTAWNWMLNAQNQVVPCAVGGGFMEQNSYNTAGRIIEKKLMLTKVNSNNGLVGTAQLVANWTYNNEGQVTTVTYPEHYEQTGLGRRQVSHGFDAMARLNSVQTKLPTSGDANPAWQSVISGVQFNAFGAVTSLNHLGNTETRLYNVLGQMTRLTKGSLIDVEYRFSATANDGKIVSQKNWLTGEDVVYQYDELERLISASTTAGTSWGLSWSYDGFGNRLAQTVTQGTGPANVVLVDGNTNRISSSGYQYDSNGNMTLMPKGSGSMTMTYDHSNRMTAVSHPDGSEQYAYAPDNRRVWRSAGRSACYAARGNDGSYEWNGFGEGAAEQLIFYSPGGQKMGVYCARFSDTMYVAISASEEHVYYGGRLVGKRISSTGGSTNVTDFTTDRLQSKGNGSNYYPYGESKTSTAGDDREGFATYTRDEKSGLDYADQRWYASSAGRFIISDPEMLSMNTKDPTSYNRYSYTRNGPIDRVDPDGLWDYRRTPSVNIPWECNLAFHSFGIMDVSSLEMLNDRCGGWSRNPPNDLVKLKIFEEVGNGGGNSDPCDSFRSKLDDAINKGQRYEKNGNPKFNHEKSLVQRALEQIFGTDEGWQGHQTVINALRSEINKLIKNMKDNNCPDPPPFADIDKLLELTSEESLRSIRDAVGITGLGYLGYRAIRLLPSLFPPFWPSLIPNLAMP